MGRTSFTSQKNQTQKSKNQSHEEDQITLRELVEDKSVMEARQVS